ncbi:MAG: alpha/beta fold hydrolase [Betaproteobacteria bacterium]|nr:alpha/beta fold hydrolase [Betaproteobacteria bacterium]
MNRSRRAFLKGFAALSAAAAGCASLPGQQPRNFILVHGAWHGAWCWDKVIPLLRADGHQVQAIDLPGHGSDVANAAGATLDSYVQRVVQAVDAALSPVVLVGHSMGGIAITGAAQARPDKVATAVFLAAFLPRSGAAMLETSRSPENESSLVGRSMVMAADKRTVTIRPDALRETFYADCSEVDIAWASARVGPQALRPLGEKVVWTPERFGRVRRVYIHTLRDRALAPQAQNRIITETGFQRVITMDTSHSPFLSQPQELARHLANA